MSDIPADLDLREQIARIDRALAETHKFQAETNKLQEEAQKLLEEGRKYRRDRWLAPWTLGVAILGGVGLGIVQLVAHLAGWWR